MTAANVEMKPASLHDPQLAETLVLDELFDLSLYKALRQVTQPDIHHTLDELITVETAHLAFWKHFFGLTLEELNLGRRLKLSLIMFVCKLFGSTAVHLVLEAIEVHGVRKYLAIWSEYQGQPLGEALRGILMDEFKHEDVLVTALTNRKINAEKVRDIFLGLNDGLVEILGAVSGFFGAFANATTVLVAGVMVGVAGALSMGAGAYLAGSSEAEVRGTDARRRRFLGEPEPPTDPSDSPIRSGMRVGLSYVVGAVVPVLPVAFGARTLLPSRTVAGGVIVLVSTILAFLSGMVVRRRIALNLGIIAAAVLISYVIGLIAKAAWGITV